MAGLIAKHNSTIYKALISLTILFAIGQSLS